MRTTSDREVERNERTMSVKYEVQITIETERRAHELGGPRSRRVLIKRFATNLWGVPPRELVGFKINPAGDVGCEIFPVAVEDIVFLGRIGSTTDHVVRIVCRYQCSRPRVLAAASQLDRLGYKTWTELKTALSA